MTAPRYSLLTRDQLVQTIDANTRSMEWFARELARLARERDAARADAEMYRRLLALRGQTCPIQLVVHRS